MSIKNLGAIQWIAAVGTAISIWLLASGTASAQYGATRNSWFPQNNPSTLSPWLEIQRFSSSELDSYNQFVRPRLEMERLLTAQTREMNRQQDIQKMMQRDISQVRNRQQRMDVPGSLDTMNYSMPAMATPTGKAATYGNYLHFYPQRTR